MKVQPCPPTSAQQALVWRGSITKQQSILDVICQASGFSKACHWWTNKLASLLAEPCGRTGGDSWARYKLKLIGGTLSTCCCCRQLFSLTVRLCRRRGVLSVLSLFSGSLNSEGTVVEPLPKGLCVFAPLVEQVVDWWKKTEHYSPLTHIRSQQITCKLSCPEKYNCKKKYV